MATPITSVEYGWFTSADLQKLFHAINALGREDSTPLVLVGGQALSVWVSYYQIPLPTLNDRPYLTQDADFKGSGQQAKQIALRLKGTARTPSIGDSTPNTATVVFKGADGKKILIDFLSGVLGVTDHAVESLSIPISINDWDAIRVLHPLLVLQSRCENLLRLQVKRDTNGITQAEVACLVVRRYIDTCLATPERHREALKAARRIAILARSAAGIFVWKQWEIDVLRTINAAQMPGDFLRSWPTEIAKVERKREIVSRPPIKRKYPRT